MVDGNPYVEAHNGGYYVSGSRVGLDDVYYAFEQGRSPEAIYSAYPSCGSLAKVYGAIAFMLDHPGEMAAYLKAQDQLFREIQDQYPMPPEMLERFEQVRKERSGQRL